MKLVLILISCVLFTCACKDRSSTSSSEVKHSNQKVDLITELSKMVINDQLAANNAFPPSEYSYKSQDAWEAFKDSIYRSHKIRLEKIIEEVGYPGHDLVGENGESNFWVMVQHCDFDPQFQQKVLNLLEIEVSRKMLVRAIMVFLRIDYDSILGGNNYTGLKSHII